MALIQAGLAFLAIALGTMAAFGPAESPLIATVSAMILLAASTLMFVLAMRRAFRVQGWIVENSVVDASSWGVVAIASILAVGAISTGVLFWLF